MARMPGVREVQEAHISHSFAPTLKLCSGCRYRPCPHSGPVPGSLCALAVEVGHPGGCARPRGGSEEMAGWSEGGEEGATEVLGQQDCRCDTSGSFPRQLVHCTPPVGTDLSFSSQQRGLD